jgi:hypothetical protein
MRRRLNNAALRGVRRYFGISMRKRFYNRKTAFSGLNEQVFCQAFCCCFLKI